MATRNSSQGWAAKIEVREFKSRAEMLEFVEDANIKIGKQQGWGYDESVHWKPLLREPKPSDIGYRIGNPRSYPNLSSASPRDFESMSPSGEITTEPGYHKGLYYGDAGFVTYNVSKGRNGEWVAHLDSRYDESPWALAGLAPYHFKTMRLEDVSDRLSRISAACATLERGSRAHAISSPASRFVLLDAGPSEGHHGANDRYTLIDTLPYNEDGPSFREPRYGDSYLYLGFGPGVSAHGEMTARDFNALKAERFRSLGKRIKIESLPANLRRLAEQFIADESTR